jgi:hypothetical protein
MCSLSLFVLWVREKRETVSCSDLCCLFCADLPREEITRIKMCACTCLFKHEYHSDLSLGVFYSTCICTHFSIYLSLFNVFYSCDVTTLFRLTKIFIFLFFMCSIWRFHFSMLSDKRLWSACLYPNVFFLFEPKEKIRYSSAQWLVFAECDETTLVDRVLGLIRD